ncbi:hypothetical protein AQUCO_02500370v1 [Aquilegia coerulea]|uniref:Rubredoxin-like domain-containing protein n=1 Tax=Aquilegia coerulea TaxID=218851 RepID=A0A2G5DAQ2_AQUCA|nr:hypothetical protein AQUCO_02500370v1 [Aquilegia coerulea]
MAVQVPTRVNLPSPLSPSPNHLGLRRPSDRFAFRSSFVFSSLNILLIPPQRQKLSIAPKFSMRLANKQAYICRDCGYIYNDRTPFEKQPDNYFCPVCAAPKRRFRPYEPKVTKNANETDARKARKAQLQRDEAIGKALPIGIAVGIVALVGLYFYINSAL